MRAALNGDFTATTSGHQRRQDGLENKRRASGGPHGKPITSGPHRSRSEGECLRTERSAFNLSAPHLTGSKNRSQMLAKKSETSPAWRGCSPCGMVFRATSVRRLRLPIRQSGSCRFVETCFARPGLSFHAYYLTQGVHNLHQVGLRGHDGLD